MTRTILKLVVLGLMVVGGWAGLFYYEQNHSVDARLREKDEQLAAEKSKTEYFQQVVKRLQVEKRVAQVIVTKQETVEGKLRTTLLFGEYSRDGKTPLLQKRFVIDGAGAHFDAYVIQFDGKYVEENDPLRGHSIALFKRIFSDNQAPRDGFVIDSPGVTPEVYKGSDPKQSEFEKNLWKDFWKLADDPAYRAQYGVKVAWGDSTFREEFKKGYIYTLSLEAAGGLKMSVEKMPPMYEQAIEENAGTQPPQ